MKNKYELKNKRTDNTQRNGKKSSKAAKSDGKSKQRNSNEDLNACAAMYDERIGALNERIELIKKRENLINEKYENQIVSNKNKDNQNWPFESYESCFLSKSLPSFSLILPTALIRLEIDGAIHGPFRALLDTGAQPMLISFTLFKRMRCSSSLVTRRVLGVGSAALTIKRKVDVVLRPWFESRYSIRDRALVLPHQDSWSPILPSTVLQVQQKDDEFRRTLADPEYHIPKEVHIILGIGFMANILDRKLGYDMFGTALVSTHFGTVVMGKYNDNLDDEDEESPEIIRTIIDDTMEEKLSKMIERLWEMDCTGTGTESNRTKEQEMVEQHFMRTHRRDEAGRFVVHIPFKLNVNDIGSSRQIALRRFTYTERKMQRDPKMKEFYITQMREEIRTGHMVEITRPPRPNEICYHIPHHCVQMETKPRIVYDGSCKTNKGISVNEVQMLGEKLQADLHETTMRLRKYKVVVCGDIKKMFNQVKIDKSQWDCQRIFWREDPKDPLKEYWLTVVTFGLTSSAYLSVRCVLQAAKEAEKEFPEAAKTIQRDFYMDDCVTGADDDEKAIEKARDIDKILLGAGFKLRKWKSNSQTVLNALNEEDPDEQCSMVFAEDGQTNILGLKWLFAKDQYTFEVKTPLIQGPLTKRKIVSCLAQLFDPNGYVGPAIVKGKLIIQMLWKMKVDWDEPLDENMQRIWERFWEEIVHLEKFRIDRWIGTGKDTKCKLIGFSDSSQSAYGAVIYIRAEYPNGTIRCNLLMSKSRVAPLKTVTIPRLELAAAELLSNVVTSVKKSMDFQDMEYVLWTDSSPALYWLRKEPDSLKTFVANRVASIQRNTDIKFWKYVNTKDNPADLLSRGVMPSTLVNNKLWLHGPDWLTKPEGEWPVEQFAIKAPVEIDLELRVHTVTQFKDVLDIAVQEPTDEEPQLIPILSYADNLEKALRVTGYVIRYLNALRKKYKPPTIATRSKERRISPPTLQEKAWAMEYFVRKSQQEYFNKELTALKAGKSICDKSKLIALNPRLDKKELMRVGGRLDKANVDYEMKHPVIIPKKSRLAWLLMDFAHRVNRHGGVQVAMQHIRQKYWIPQLRDELKQYTRKCIECVRNKPLTEDQLMGDLPAERVCPGHAFEVTGVDYAGPFSMKYIERNGEEITRVKAWVALFVCMKTRAVHLEIVEDLTSSAFIACYERFVARRGSCYKMYSDNGTSFVGAEREIARAYKKWQQDGTVDSVAKRGTDWKFMTPGAPHQGGIYEAAVKSMKHHLRRVVGARLVEHQQFRTLLCNIEAVLNSRPLTPLTDDPEDIQALTPGHFLMGGPLVVPPPFRHMNDENSEGKKLWIERQKMLTHFWQRWQNEYLTTLQERKKWRREKENVKVGQLVLIRDETLPPAQWKLGRIIELFPGRDGLVRNVLIKTAKGELKRPVQKICILPIDSAIPTNGTDSTDPEL